MKKITKPNRELSKENSVRKPLKTFHEEYFDLYRGKIVPISKDWIEGLGSELWNGVQNGDFITIAEFCSKKGIHRSSFNRWINKYETLKLYYDAAKEFMGAQRFRGMATNKYNYKVIGHTQHNYDHEWEEANKYHAALKEQTMEKMPDVIILPAAPIPAHLIEDKKEKDVNL